MGCAVGFEPDRPITVQRRLDERARLVPHGFSAAWSRRPDSNRQPFEWNSITLHLRPVERARSDERQNALPVELHLLAVWVTGIAPAASASRTPRSSTELHPEKKFAVPKGQKSSSGCHTARRPRSEIWTKHATSESNAAPLLWRPRPSQTVAYEVVPLRGFEPQPSTFAESCPVRGTVAFVSMAGVAPATAWLSPTSSYC